MVKTSFSILGLFVDMAMFAGIAVPISLATLFLFNFFWPTMLAMYLPLFTAQLPSKEE